MIAGNRLQRSNEDQRTLTDCAIVGALTQTRDVSAAYSIFAGRLIWGRSPVSFWRLGPILTISNRHRFDRDPRSRAKREAPGCKNANPLEGSPPSSRRAAAAVALPESAAKPPASLARYSQPVPQPGAEMLGGLGSATPQAASADETIVLELRVFAVPAAK